MRNPIDKGIVWPIAQCCFRDVPDSIDGHCVCEPMEAALRGWMRGDAMPAMNTDQRAACIVELATVEGYWPNEYADASDADLARVVLDAWTDYCRDMGLL